MMGMPGCACRIVFRLKCIPKAYARLASPYRKRARLSRSEAPEVDRFCPIAHNKWRLALFAKCLRIILNG